MEFIYGMMAALFCGAVVIRLWDNHRCANTTYTSPPAPPPPTRQYNGVVVEFPDGSKAVVDKSLLHGYINYVTPVDWTPPMTELFLLLVKDWKNWEQCMDFQRRALTVDVFAVVYKHVPLGITLTIPSEQTHLNLFGTSLSLDSTQTRCVVELAQVWKYVNYEHKLRRISSIKQYEIKRIRLGKAKKEATMINEYLDRGVK